MRRTGKDWSILIYADCNNELAPEIWTAIAALNSRTSSNRTHVAIQIARGDEQTIGIMRPSLRRYTSSWSGTRRYTLSDTGLHLVDELGPLNMAHPIELTRFLQWALDYCPAKQFLVILSGHGYKFVGGLTDYGQEAPYIMGFPGMVDAIHAAFYQRNQVIDILMLDICHTNFIEVLFEFGKYETSPIRTVVAHQEDAPIEDLPYTAVIDLINMHPGNNAHQLVRAMVKKLNFNLVANNNNHRYLASIQRSCNALATHWLGVHELKQKLAVNELFQHTTPASPWYSKLQKLHQEIQSTILCYRETDAYQAPINIATVLSEDPKDRERYCQLAFNQQNNWPHLLTGGICKNQGHWTPVMEPIVLTQKDVRRNVAAVNPWLTKEQAQSIAMDLFVYRKWDQ